MRRVYSAALVMATVATASFWYWSPLLVVHRMQAAAKAGDADAFSLYVDYPLLRESLKGQLSAAMLGQLNKGGTEQEGGLAKAGAAFGAALGMAMVDRLVDALVRPETVMQAMQQGKMMPKKEGDQHSNAKTERVTWESERVGLDKYILYANQPGAPRDQRAGLAFDRNGFADWKLTEVRLPSLR